MYSAGAIVDGRDALRRCGRSPDRATHFAVLPRCGRFPDRATPFGPQVSVRRGSAMTGDHRSAACFSHDILTRDLVATENTKFTEKNSNMGGGIHPPCPLLTLWLTTSPTDRRSQTRAQHVVVTSCFCIESTRCGRSSDRASHSGPQVSVRLGFAMKGDLRSAECSGSGDPRTAWETRAQHQRPFQSTG